MEFNRRMLFICPAKRYFRPDKMTIITDERCTAYHSPGHPERPFRVSGPVKKLKAQTDLKLQWLKPEPAPKAKVLRAHTTNHFQRLAEPHDFDGDTAYHEGIRDHALTQTFDRGIAHRKDQPVDDRVAARPLGHIQPFLRDKFQPRDRCFVIARDLSWQHPCAAQGFGCVDQHGGRGGLSGGAGLFPEDHDARAIRHRHRFQPGGDHGAVEFRTLGLTGGELHADRLHRARRHGAMFGAGGGELQREMAYRFGVNWVMYALTGNYKTDQVHVPAIIERLGQ